MRNDGDLLLSVVIPVHNMSGRLQNLEESISAGKNMPVEFLLIDDYSADSTRDELKAIIDRNKNLEINLISGEFGSPGMARNAGLNQVRAPYVMFADSDDKFFLNNIEKELSKISKETQILIGSYRQVDLVNGGKSEHEPKIPLYVSLTINPGMWRMVFKTSEIRNIKFKNYRMAEDQLWLAEIQILNRKVETSKSIFYEYYSNDPKSLTSSMTAKQDLNKVLLEYLTIINSHPGLVSQYILMSFSKLWMSAFLNTKNYRVLFSLLISQTLRTPAILKYFIRTILAIFQNKLGKYVKK